MNYIETKGQKLRKAHRDTKTATGQSSQMAVKLNTGALVIRKHTICLLHSYSTLYQNQRE
jgi:hypothetical protein